MAQIITLLTDFGTRDGYVGQMKGMILGIAPLARLVDVTHDIEPFAVLEAALVLKGISSCYPAGTIHVAVVDPGVGSGRRGITIKSGTQIFVGPDNGLFSLALGSSIDTEVREITNPELVRPDPQPTFHGRDVFAPVAAHLAAGAAFESAGPIVCDPVRLSLPEIVPTAEGLRGEVLFIDRYGNLCTNIEAARLTAPVEAITVRSARISGVRRFFSEVPEGSPIALINSFGMLEIAVHRGDASRLLRLGKGAAVEVRWA